jgi:uroporphyrinogen-III synthase
MSLVSLKIAVTASRRASELAQIITNFGGIPHIVPTIGIETTLKKASNEIEAFVNKIIEDQKMEYVVFMTGPSVYLIMSVATNLGLKSKLIEALNKAIIISRNHKTKQALAVHGVKTDVIPKENTSQGIARALKDESVMDKHIAIVQHGSEYSSILKNELAASGATVFVCSTYIYSLELEANGARILDTMGFNYKPPNEDMVVKLIEEINKGLIDAITFTSPPAVSGLFKIAEKYRLKEKLKTFLNENTIVAAVGPSTEKALSENGIKADVIPKVYKMGSMIKALVDYIVVQNRQDGKLHNSRLRQP